MRLLASNEEIHSSIRGCTLLFTMAFDEKFHLLFPSVMVARTKIGKNDATEYAKRLIRVNYTRIKMFEII